MLVLINHHWDRERRSSPLGTCFPYGLLDGEIILRRRLRLGPAAFQKCGALLARQGLALAEHDRAFVKLEIQGVARLKLGVLTQFEWNYNFAIFR
jgi:hypothetical protein